MDMMEEANAATAQGDLADVVARANAVATRTRAFVSTHLHQLHPPPPPAASPMPPHCPAQFTIPYDHGPTSIDATMFEAAPATVVDPYLSPDGYGLQQPLAVQISQQHALCGGDVVMGAGVGAAATDDGEDAIRISSLTPAAHHQMIKRKNEVKKVVCIPAPPATSGRAGGGEVIPSDLWAWRKYGQKPIKGSPYPRGYYRCSSSKGCMARKQVERSRSDPNMLVITYTAEHNHPWPMQRNVLAGYARSHHTHAAAASSSSRKQQTKQQLPVIATSISSSSSSSHNAHAHQQHADLLGGQMTNMMMTAAGNGVAALGNGGIQPAADEVFAELEELEPDNHMINANMLYSMSSSGGSSSSSSRPGVSSCYDWHKF